jgi:hypothetical protein
MADMQNCPKTKPHPPHTWHEEDPEGGMPLSHQCSGV